MFQNDCLDSLRQSLLAKHIIELSGKVDEDMGLYVREALLRLIAKDSPALHIIITSPGGSVRKGLVIYDAFRLYSGEKTCTVVGEANSMGAVIVQACQKRRISRHSRMLIHDVSFDEVSLGDIRDPSKFAKFKKAIEDDQLYINTIIANRSGRTMDEIASISAKAESLTAQEALAFGFVDEIV